MLRLHLWFVLIDQKHGSAPFDGKRSTDIDSSIVTTYMMMEATDLDLGSIWVCFFDPEVLRDEFKIPKKSGAY